MKKTSIRKIVVSILCAALFCVPAMAANPGSADDPLITESYLNDVLIPQLKSYVDAKVASVSGSSVSIGQTSVNSVFNVVNVTKGQTVVGGQSCQMILRMGAGSIIASTRGGVADVTAGVDLANGSTVPANHLLIFPLDDGRAIRMLSDGILMISGIYSIR
ncbi:MAG: hypothetical protein E7395_02725 [Ruminococcaceae bacterium]|nr:hypothetical protein [Oscillospiraceae bacterium]